MMNQIEIRSLQERIAQLEAENKAQQAALETINGAMKSLYDAQTKLGNYVEAIDALFRAKLGMDRGIGLRTSEKS